MKKKEVSIEIIEKGYKVSLYLYDGDNNEEAFDYLYESDQKENLMAGKIILASNGFCAVVNGEVQIFINTASKENKEDVLVHELYHAATRLSEIMNSEEFGARSYTMLYEEFLPFVKENITA